MPKVLITTAPFAVMNNKPLKMLEKENIEYFINPMGRKLKERELANMIYDFDALIAGTEKISDKVLDKANKLKIISRVGVGLDNLDLSSAKKNKILVTYTPEAPAPAVAELTIGLMISIIRHTHQANQSMHRKKWNRYFGKRFSKISIGIIGAGRIGSDVINKLSALSPKKILVNDIDKSRLTFSDKRISKASKEQILKKADLVSLHLPLTKKTKNMLSYEDLKLMKSDAFLINTSRGGIIREKDLIKVLKEGHLSAVAIDVFENEPYVGGLIGIENCLLTSHMGSMTEDCRTKMEIEATEEIVRYFKNKKLKNLVPEEEYKNQY